MFKYIIDYDLLDENADYENLIGKIETIGITARIAKSSWCLLTNKSAKEIRDELEKEINCENRLFVGKLSGNAAWNKAIESSKLKELLEKV